MAVFTYMCVCSNFPVYFHYFLRKCSLMWYALKHGVAHNPMLHSGHLNFILVALFIAEHTQHPVLFLSTGQCLLCIGSSLFNWLMDGTCLLCLVVWVQGTHHISYIRSLTVVSLNGWCDNFEPQEERMKTQLRMVNSRRCKNGLFVYF